ncbi:MAG TPA: amidohydrolase family protein [Chloroflexota bacterium]|nr:amidohydrolase family protein [Chloroflexota bacterium]
MDVSSSSGEWEDLPLNQFSPRPALVTAECLVERARFAAIDMHNHLGRWLTPRHAWMVPDVPALLTNMEACNVRCIVNLDGRWGHELEENLNRYDRTYPDHFITFAQVDWSLAKERDFGGRLARQFEDSVARGARGLKVWKELGLAWRDARQALIPIDDARLHDLWECAGALDMPVLIHIADPVAFFQPLDRHNERYEELCRHPDWHFYGRDLPTFEELIEQFERLIAEHPRTTFIGAHVGCYAENLGWVARMLDMYPNFNVDISARLAELGRQPYAARRFFTTYHSRIAFGVDAFPPTPAAYAPYFRFLETADEYFPYDASGEGSQGRWRIYGLDLPDDVLRDVYSETATRLLVRGQD